MKGASRRTASEVQAAKVRGVDPHDADLHPDPPHVQWQEGKSAPPEARYGSGLGPILEEAGENLKDPDRVSRPASKASMKRPKRYRAGAADLSVDAVIGHSAIDALWSGPGSAERSALVGLVKGTLEAIKPKNELEGLIAVQLIAAHGAAIENYRRAMIPEQMAAARSECFNQAAKASRTFATLLEALDRHRGKGSQQRVRVEHVHVYEGGQAIVGNVAPRGGGRGRKGISRQSDAKQPAALTHAPQSPLRSEDPKREALPVGSDAERPLPHARRHQSRRADG